MGYLDIVDFEDMLGKTFRKVTQNGNNSLTFEVSDDEAYIMYYEPDCCASCNIEDVCGDLEDLVDTPIVRAEQNSNDEPDLPSPESHPESFTWTFYRIGTNKGTVVVRWYGSSNGYYSETPTFQKVN